MNSTTPKFIPLDKSLDGARILWRYYLSTYPPTEGWVREFSKEDPHVRISRTNSAYDAGKWFRITDLRVEAILDEAKVPALKKEEDRPA